MRRIIQNYLGEEFVKLLRSSFFFFILSVILSQIAINMLNVTLIFFVYFLTSSNFLVSLLLLSFLLPQIFLSFIGGVFVEARNKKTVLIYGNVLRALLVLFLFLNIQSLFLVYIVSFLAAVITQFYIPAETPLIPRLIEHEKLTQANSLFGVALFGSIMVGYVIAGPSILLLGRSSIFLFIAALFLLASFFLRFIPTSVGRDNMSAKPVSLREKKNSLLDEFARTYSLLGKEKEVLLAFFVLSFSQIVIFILATVIPGYAKTVLHATESETSLLLFGPAAAGMIAASFLIGRLLLRFKRQELINVGIFLSGIVLCLLPLAKLVRTIPLGNIQLGGIHVAMVLAFFAGFSNALLFVPSQTIIQERIPETFRSKIYGLLFSITGVMSFLPVLIAGGIADLVGVANVLFGMGGAVLLLGFAKVRMWGERKVA